MYVQEGGADDRDARRAAWRVGGETQAQTAVTALPDALAAWLESAQTVRASLDSLLK